MSKHETPMTLAFWQHCAPGTLYEEYQLVKKAEGQGCRYVDAVILPDGPNKRCRREEYESLAGKNVIVIQAKAKRLGMYLMGQALFSAALARKLGALSVRSIILCTKSDVILKPLLDSYPELEVWTVDTKAVELVPSRVF